MDDLTVGHSDDRTDFRSTDKKEFSMAVSLDYGAAALMVIVLEHGSVDLWAVWLVDYSVVLLVVEKADTMVDSSVDD